MTDKNFEQLFKQSDEITPDAELKGRIIARAGQEMAATARKKEKRSPGIPSLAKKLMPIAACLALVLMLLGGALGLGNEKYQTVYIDVNPSVALHVNRLGRISGVEYLNEDAARTLNGTRLKGLLAEDALESMITVYGAAGYLDRDAEIYIGAVSPNSKNADKLLAKLSERAERIKGNQNYTVNTTKLTAEDRAEADGYGISPGKYRVISEIIEEHPEYTVEELKDRSMAELKELLTKGKGNKK